MLAAEFLELLNARRIEFSFHAENQRLIVSLSRSSVSLEFLFFIVTCEINNDESDSVSSDAR